MDYDFENEYFEEFYEDEADWYDGEDEQPDELELLDDTVIETEFYEAFSRISQKLMLPGHIYVLNRKKAEDAVRVINHLKRALGVQEDAVEMSLCTGNPDITQLEVRVKAKIIIFSKDVFSKFERILTLSDSFAVRTTEDGESELIFRFWDCYLEI